ncbi:MAG: rhomboid family intramembrane serine protease [Phycisphaerae bacterium]|nr:rhomboid family intramembrane serine protease [Phycisphaerae bacterium]
MLLPIRTSIQPRRTPYANYIIIIANVICYLLTFAPHVIVVEGVRVAEPLRPWAQMFMLTPVRPYLWQFVTYAFLHGSLMHIFGNMYFLYIFGNNVNDKLGNVGYICLYLAGAVFAGIGHTMLHTNPVLGASGAVAAVTGAYLVLFPQTVITIIYWFIFIGTMQISALYFIAFKLIVWDNWIQPMLAPGAVAYDAHLAGYACGIAAMLLLLSLKLVEGNYTDLWSMIKQWNRRRQFRDTVNRGYDPFSGQGDRKRVSVKEVKGTDGPQVQHDEIALSRAEIARLIGQRNLPEAAVKYLQLMAKDPEQVLPRQYQLDIANQLMAEGKWLESAHAYEAFLAQYPTYEYIEQVRLMLGIIYSRYLNEPEKAIIQLTAAKDKLTDPGQLRMCNDELTKLQNQ